MIRFFLGILTTLIVYLLWQNWHSLGFWSGICLAFAVFVVGVVLFLLSLLRSAAPHANNLLKVMFDK
jgi:hypothetical protein